MWIRLFIRAFSGLVGTVLGIVLLPISTVSAVGPDAPEEQDFAAYVEANVASYRMKASSNSQSGMQFSAPGGYRCRIVNVVSPKIYQRMKIECWGTLPLVTENLIWVNNLGSSGLKDIDVATQDRYVVAGPKKLARKKATYTAADYKPLDPGSKLSYSGSNGFAMCAVDQEKTMCLLQRFDFETSCVLRFGFVISPQGSQISRYPRCLMQKTAMSGS